VVDDFFHAFHYFVSEFYAPAVRGSPGLIASPSAHNPLDDNGRKRSREGKEFSCRRGKKRSADRLIASQSTGSKRLQRLVRIAEVISGARRGILRSSTHSFHKAVWLVTLRTRQFRVKLRWLRKLVQETPAGPARKRGRCGLHSVNGSGI
jgi:hypothetical protein